LQSAVRGLRSAVCKFAVFLQSLLLPTRCSLSHSADRTPAAV